MPLISKSGASAPRELGLFWPMETPEGMTLDVYIYASTLQAFDTEPVGPVGLLKRHRSLLEAVASDKYDREGTTSDGTLHITADDLTTDHESLEMTTDET
ncbi:hypothetical protein GB927_028365 [Shinella sp. CPCC 100929]|uniref:Uncharacterized protein n=1 Tax=Shinella lacus TaxID=2654216 RepID=A0ABT1RFV6_9HYPH|nr:hypothetical protein [Shinella lacus]MCQ4633979.1 hypothetical protein [Shinella lacus]